MSEISRAVTIFKCVESADFLDADKVIAIYDVMNMPTHNGITKAEILTALKWLWNHVFYLANENKATMTNYEKIQQMSIEEMAEFIQTLVDCPGCYAFILKEKAKNCNKNCQEHFIDWLNSAAVDWLNSEVTE